jgi:hypothetical protein
MKKLVLIAALGLVATPAFAWGNNPLDAYNPFPRYQPLPCMACDAARNMNIAPLTLTPLPQPQQQTRCDSVPNGMGGWRTICN